MSVRFFGGFGLNQDDLNGDLVAAGYGKGVPMGGDISLAQMNDPAIKAPTFIIQATMDPESANLDRIQVVKGWIDSDGQTHEKIFNVAWSNSEQRQIDEEGNLPAVGNTVDINTATWKNTIGVPELTTAWQDPEFNASDNAFYYARVLEIPTPTWPLYDAVKHGIKLTPEITIIQQERAYTSPIWYRAG